MNTASPGVPEQIDNEGMKIFQFFKKSPRFELSPEFYKELGDSLIENLTAKTKRDVMGSVIENPDEAIEMLGAVQRSARTLISAFRISPVQSPALGSRIAQTGNLVRYCDELIESLRSNRPEERIQPVTHTDALFADQSQSILDNLVALLAKVQRRIARTQNAVCNTKGTLNSETRS
jgi:hypothetical protein